MNLFGITASDTLDGSTRVSVPNSRSEMTWVARSCCEGDIKVDMELIAFSNAHQTITEVSDEGRGWKRNAS